MANNDRLNNAIDNVIDALNVLKDAWNEAQDSYTPQVIISDEPPVTIPNEVPKQFTAPVTFSEPEPAPIPLPVPPIPPVPETPPAPPVQTYAPVENPQMQTMFCDNCGTKLRPGAKFCSNCGTPA